MNEWLMIAVCVWCAALFALGGTGWKPARRFIMPAGLAWMALLYAPWWACVGYWATMSAVLCLGYGERSSWLKRAFIFIGYGAASLWFGVSWWVLVAPILLTAGFLLSNIKLTARSFPWKLWEVGAGLLIACCYIASLQNQWRGL